MGKIKELLANKQFLSLAGNAIMAFLNIVTMAIISRNMPHESELGDWFFFQATFVFIDTFRTGFLQTAFIKFFAGADKARADNVLGSVWALGLSITLVICIISIPGFIFIHDIERSGIVTAIKWVAITFISTLPIVVATWILQAQQRYKEILLIRVVNQGSFFIFVISLIFFRQNTLSWFLSGNLISCTVTSIYVMSRNWTGIKTIGKQTWSSMVEIYHFGKFSVGTSISANLLRYSDTFLIEMLLVPIAPKSLAIYGIAQALINVLDIPLRSFVTTGMTSLSAAQNNNRKEEIEYIFQKYAGALSIIFIPLIVGSIIFADVAVWLVSGSRFSGTPAANIFRIFMLIGFINPLDRFTGVTLDIIHKPKINFYKVFAMLVVNVIGDLTGIYLLHNIYGVGLASIPTMVVGTLIGYFSLKRYLNFSFRGMMRLGWEETLILYQTIKGKISPKAA